MKKRLISLAISSLVCVVAHADELSDAIGMYQKHQYEQARQVFSKLAVSGNTQAQEQLADMYWFGDGMPIDLSQAEYWFAKAALAGSQKAKQSLVVMRARVALSEEIAFYTTRFENGNLRFKSSGCVPPALPVVSKTNTEIREASHSIERWFECYNRYVARLRAALPASSAIPKDLIDLMTDDDLAKATSLIDKSVLSYAAEAKEIATRVSSEIEDWKRETENFVTGANAKKSGMTPAEYELFEASRKSSIDSQRLDRAMNKTKPPK